MRGLVGRLLLASALGCAPRAEVEPEASSREAAETAKPAPAGPAEGGPAVADGDRVMQRAAGGQWVAVCRTDDHADPQPRLVLAAGTERPLEELEATDESGRFVLLTHAGHRWLLDTTQGHERDLGPVAHTIAGSFVGPTLAYGRRTGPREELVLHDALTHAERVWPSPAAGLHRVELDRSGHGLWITTLEPGVEPAEEDPLDERLRQDAARSPPSMCAPDPGCLSTRAAPRRLGLLWLGATDESPPTFVDLDETPAHPRALAGAAVIESDRGIELVYADRRETIAEPGCRLDPEHYDPEVLRLLCEQDDARVRIERWHDGRREPWTACGP